MTTFGFLFLPILVAYYPLLMGCCDLAKGGQFPPCLVWLPNVLMCGIGAAFMKRVVRY